MESICTIINNMSCHDMPLKKENMPCTCYETINKRDYVLLLKQLEDWRVFAPKAIVKKYGVITVKTAIEYTKATKNVRVPGAYFTYMVRQLKKDLPQSTEKTSCPVKEEIHTNIPKEHKIEYKGSQLPQIDNWQDARKFLCDYLDGAYEKTNNVINFVEMIKKKYNFG